MAACHVLDRRQPYRGVGADWFAKRRPEAQARLAHQLETLGYRVTLAPAA